MDSLELLASLRTETTEIRHRVAVEYVGLGEDQLQWRPSDSQWSIAEGIEHLNLTLGPTGKRIEEAIDQAIENKIAPTDGYHSGWAGELMVKLMDTTEERQARFRFRTSKSLNPIYQQLSGQKVLEEFLLHLDHYEALLKKAALVNLNKVRVKLLDGSFLRFRLGDTLRFLNAHTVRHLHQVQRVRDHQEFPIHQVG